MSARWQTGRSKPFYPIKMTLDYSQMKIAWRMLQNMIKDKAQTLRLTTQNSGSLSPLVFKKR